jgi:hypothetical protein
MFLCDPYVHLNENFQSTVPLLQSQSLASRFFDWTLPSSHGSENKRPICLLITLLLDSRHHLCNRLFS